MPIAFLLAMVLSQAAPGDSSVTSAAQAPAASSAEDIAAPGSASNLPKDDYGLVAWCHGALAGQLELDPIAHADMISIEGKAKVAARAKADAEMEKDRRAYLHDYERALSAAEKASPTAIHQYGVESEVAGYRLWGATREKQPIWRMLDWGMWDANDAGCGDAAKRLYNKATLFGEALKGSADDKAGAEKTDAEAPLPPGFADHTTATDAKGDGPVAASPEPAQAAPASDVAPIEAVPAMAVPAESPAQTPDAAAPANTPVAAKAKTARSKVAVGKSKKTKVVTAKAATAPPEASAAPIVETPPAESPPAAAPTPAAQPTDSPLRGPQL